MDNIPRETKLKLVILVPISILTIFLLTIPIFKTQQRTHIHFHVQNHLQDQALQVHQVARSLCEGTRYHDLCVTTLSAIPNLHKKSMAEILMHTINVTETEVQSSESEVSGIRCGPEPNNVIQRWALYDCLELLDGTMDELKEAYNDMVDSCGGPARRHDEIQTMLSAAMTNQYTCLDGFAVGKNRTIRKYIQPGIFNISRHVSNSLAILQKTTRNRHHAKSDEVVDRDGFPKWMSKKDRRLLQTAEGGNGTAPPSAVVPDLVVAQDGTGNFTTITEAVAAAPEKSKVRFVIYIKQGAYFENVEVDKKKFNIMFLGDGIGKTWIKGNRNVIDGWTTFRSATLAVVGKGFIMKGITVENYAGPEKHQAVALRSGADLSAFYQCSFVAYQDTLYTHSLRQFYRECDVYGTVDFIFGNAAVVFQKCNLYARKPLENQKNMFTAQGREDPNQNTGISILNSKITAASDLAANKSYAKSFLGRPWKEFSRTVVMLSYIDDVVDPKGWLEWSGDFALSTLFYGEYMNRGPGANTSARVTWPGFQVINSSLDASNFTVGNFIQGGEWLPGYGIPFYLNLTS